MTARDTFTTIVDGDQLNQGYFNDLGRYVFRNHLYDNLNALKLTYSPAVTASPYFFGAINGTGINVATSDAAQGVYALKYWLGKRYETWPASLSANWTTNGSTGSGGAVTGGTGGITVRVDNSSSIVTGTIAAYANAMNFKAQSGDSIAYMQMSMSYALASGGHCHGKIQITDGTSVVDLYTLSAPGIGSATDMASQPVHFVFDKAGGNVKLYLNGSLQSTTSISALTSWYIRLYADSGNGNGTTNRVISVSEFNYITTTPTANTLYTTASTLPSSRSLATAIVGITGLGTGTSALYVSCNNGSNYSGECSSDVQLTNAGTQGILKLIITPQAPSYANGITTYPYIYEWGVQDK